MKEEKSYLICQATSIKEETARDDYGPSQYALLKCDVLDEKFLSRGPWITRGEGGAAGELLDLAVKATRTRIPGYKGASSLRSEVISALQALGCRDGSLLKARELILDFLS